MFARAHHASTFSASVATQCQDMTSGCLDILSSLLICVAFANYIKLMMKMKDSGCGSQQFKHPSFFSSYDLCTSSCKLSSSFGISSYSYEHGSFRVYQAVST